ncbi:MAG: Dyp-type peroxidase [Betaproteobacteria bacterium]
MESAGEQLNPDQSSKHLQGVTDITLLAPIKQGLIDALDTRTYANRLKLLMRALNSLRSSSREFAAFRPFSDGAERICTIHSLRLAILEPEQKLLLAVTFDRPWEPYIRIIWRDVGTLLDVIFCNCEGYVTAYNHSAADYFEWVHKAQIDAQFFYNAAPLTVDDLQYLRKVERLQRDSPASVAADLAATKIVIEDPEAVALQTAKRFLESAQPPGTPSTAETTETTGLKALGALYRLTEVYPADKDDGGYLLRAAHEILKEFRALDTKVLFPRHSEKRNRFRAQLDWFERPAYVQAPTPTHEPAYRPEDIQAGIISSTPDATHGCLVLIGISDAHLARGFLAGLAVTTEEVAPAPGSVSVNVALTCQGLRRLGVPEQEMEKFPKEFREGMEARADLLGDVRANHPRNWALPERNWPYGNAAGGISARVQISSVDLLVQLRVNSASSEHEIVNNPAHPLFVEVQKLANQKGLQVLSVQAMRRYMDATLPYPREHFGFIDGISQPEISAVPAGPAWNNVIARGDALLGYVKSNLDVPERSALRDNGSFLVVRKLRQNVDVLERVLAKEVAKGKITQDELKAKMMGRTVDGTPLADSSSPQGNSFDYSGDLDGAKCPFQAHIRRANPRTPAKSDRPDQPTVPRIIRRGMSYGPKYDENKPDSEARGLMFMAYNASIAEQFEVIQRWISGGNSTGVFSGQSDPLLGVPQLDDPRTFRFGHGQEVVRVELDATGARPMVELEWGAYLFVPSLNALQEIGRGIVAARPLTDALERGEKKVQELLDLERHGVPEAEVIAAWKACLEDFDAKIAGETEAVWAAIRENHGGVLRTVYGVLVASKKLVMEVFENASGRYSVKGYYARMHESIGENYLGLDQGQAYLDQSTKTNAAIRSIAEQDAFDAARAATKDYLGILLTNTGEASFDTRELSDEVLLRLAGVWFNLPDDLRLVQAGGWDWTPTPPRRPRCPGDFTSPSRYLFSPNPGSAVKKYGTQHGQALQDAVTNFVQQKRNDLDSLSALSRELFDAIPNDDRQLARTIVGAMMGFLPTVDGTLRSTLYEWVDENTLWRLQEAFLSHPDRQANPYAAAGAVLRAPLMRTMQRRPVPDMVWRTAVEEHDLGNLIKIRVDDKIVVGIGSATQEDLSKHAAPDVFPIFGGERGSTGAPTHACPAYSMAMGVLLGALSALLDSGTLYPTPSPTGLMLKTQ